MPLVSPSRFPCMFIVPHPDSYIVQAKFFEDYALAHKKLSELGSKWEPAEGITL